MSAAQSRRVFTGLNLDDLVRPDAVRGGSQQLPTPPRYPNQQRRNVSSPRVSLSTFQQDYLRPLSATNVGFGRNSATKSAAKSTSMKTISDPWFNLNPPQQQIRLQRQTLDYPKASPFVETPHEETCDCHSSVPPSAAPVTPLPCAQEEAEWDPMDWVLPPINADTVGEMVVTSSAAASLLGVLDDSGTLPPPIPSRHRVPVEVAPAMLSNAPSNITHHASVSTLPLELLGLVFSFSELGTIARAPVVCSRWNAAIRLDCSWHGLAIALVGCHAVKGCRQAVREKLLAHSAEIEVDLRRAEDLHQRTLSRMDQRNVELRNRFQQEDLSEQLDEDQARGRDEAARRRDWVVLEEERVESELLSHCTILLDQLEASSSALQSRKGLWYELESNRRNEESNLHRIESMVDWMEREFYATTASTSSKGTRELRDNRRGTMSFSVKALESRVVTAILVSCGFRILSPLDGKPHWEDPWNLAATSCRTISELEVLLEHVRGHRTGLRPASASGSGFPRRVTLQRSSGGPGLSEGIIRLLIQWRRLRPSLEWFVQAVATGAQRTTLSSLWATSGSESTVLDDAAALRLLAALEEASRSR